MRRRPRVRTERWQKNGEGDQKERATSESCGLAPIRRPVVAREDRTRLA